MARLTATVLAAAALAPTLPSLLLAEEATARVREGSVRAAPLEPIHPLALRTCRVSRLLRPICPRRVLRAFYPRSGIFLAPARRLDVRYEHFNVEGFGERGDRQRPQVRHLVLYASRRSLTEKGGPFDDWPSGATPAGIRDGLTRRSRLAPPRLLARVRWAGRRGALVLERPYPNGGIDGNHVVFYWRQAGIEYAASLHEWEPLREAVATLHAIVHSMPRPRLPDGPGALRQP